MEGHGIVGVLIHALDDVDFTCIGPIGAHHPAMSPCQSLATRTMIKKKMGSYKAGQVPQMEPGM